MRSKVKKEKNVRSKVKRKTAERPREAAPQLVRRDGSLTGAGGGGGGRGFMASVMEHQWLKESGDFLGESA